MNFIASLDLRPDGPGSDEFLRSEAGCVVLGGTCLDFNTTCCAADGGSGTAALPSSGFSAGAEATGSLVAALLAAALECNNCIIALGVCSFILLSFAVSLFFLGELGPVVAEVAAVADGCFRST